MNTLNKTLLAVSTALGLAACAATGEKTYDLDFSKQNYTTQSIEIDGQTVRFRAYEGIVYVRHPVDIQYETINIYIPEAYYKGGTIDGYTADTAPIFLPNQIGGYMPATPAKPALETKRGEAENSPKTPNAALTALSKGYVVASLGARGRTLSTGKAPAAIVDLKAAVRYLKANDKIMPGDAQKIISNGTSAGGALSLLLGATGNHEDYQGHLKALGAADASDDIFAVSAYCPITDLDHADMAYEWQFNGVNDYKKMNITMLDYNVKRELVDGTLTEDEKKLSNLLKPRYSAYINSLRLKSPDGRTLMLDAKGNGSFKNHIARLLAQSAQKQLDAGKNLSNIKWLTVRNGKAVAVDFDAYAKAAGRQKTPPAFDGIDLGTGENQLFGNIETDKRHFTAFSARHNTVPGAETADEETVKVMNPLNYIGKKGAKPAQTWRIRVGTDDRDTSLAVSATVAAKLQNSGHTVDYALPWGVGHSGDYDLEELFAWMKQISTAPAK